MRARVVIVANVFCKDSPQMPFAEDDHVVKAFSPDGANDSFHVGILPRGARRGDDLHRLVPPVVLDYIAKYELYR